MRISVGSLLNASAAVLLGFPRSLARDFDSFMCLGEGKPPSFGPFHDTVLLEVSGWSLGSKESAEGRGLDSGLVPGLFQLCRESIELRSVLTSLSTLSMLPMFLTVFMLNILCIFRLVFCNFRGFKCKFRYPPCSGLASSEAFELY
jgi:hypothetical protein